MEILEKYDAEHIDYKYTIDSYGERLIMNTDHFRDVLKRISNISKTK